MFDPYDDKQVAKLKTAMDLNWRLMQPFRRNRIDFLKQYLGSRYSDCAASMVVYANLLNQTAEVSTISLVAQNPQVLIETDDPRRLSFARKMQVNVNNLLLQMHFDTIMRRGVLDSYFSIGMYKVGLGDSPSFLPMESSWVDPGRPFVSNISLDRLVFDMQVLGWERIRFCGDFYDVPIDALKGNDAFDQKEVEKLSPRVFGSSNSGTVRGGEVSAQSLSQDRERSDSDLRDMANLVDVYIPDGDWMLTFPEDLSGKPLAARHVKENPYIPLGMQDAPDNVMPVSPAMKAISLHELYNSLLRKQARQARRQRDIPYYMGDSAEDAARIEKAEDGRWTRVNRIEGVGTLKMGGVDQGNHGFSMSLQDMFDRLTDARQMSGGGPQAETLGQEEILAGRADVIQAAKHNRVVECTNTIVKRLASLMWSDPINHYNAYDSLTEFPGLKLPANIPPWQREGKFDDYSYRIEQYSMSYQSPKQRASTLISTLKDVYAPMMPFIQAQGGMIDMDTLNDELSMLLDSPVLKRVVKFGEPKVPQDPASQGDNAKPQFDSDHVYTRKNISTGDNGRFGRSGAVQAMMAPQPSGNGQQQ